jgi:hypothetical protein
MSWSRVPAKRDVPVGLAQLAERGQGGEFAQHHSQVREDVALGVKNGVLRALAERFEPRERRAERGEVHPKVGRLGAPGDSPHAVHDTPST